MGTTVSGTKISPLRCHRPWLAIACAAIAVAAANCGGWAHAVPAENGQPATSRLPAPAEGAQRTALARFRAYFTQHYGRATPRNEKLFSQYLLKKYANAHGRPTARYVALTLAWKFSAAAADIYDDVKPIQLLGRDYLVNPWRLYLKASERILQGLNKPWEGVYVRALGHNLASWAKQAGTAGDLESAGKMLELAQRCFERSHAPHQLAKLRTEIARFRLSQATAPQVAADRKLLQIHRTNPEALLRMALYHWLVSGKPNARAIGEAEAQKTGYASLAGIMKLAAQDSLDAQQLIHLGNLWWNLPKTHKLLAYTPLVQQHAIKIYRRAIPGVARAFSAMIGRGDYHAAVLLIGQAKKAAKRTRDPKMLSIARQWNRMLRQARMLHRRYITAIKTLATKADDPQANQTVGIYTCFLGADWHTGLAYLKLSGLPGLRAAARADLANPETPAAQIALGNTWWRLARGYRGIMRKNIELRAAHWYAAAFKKLPVGRYKTLRFRVARLQMEK